MVHIVDRPYNWFPYGFSKSGVPMYTEYYPNAIADVYSGKTGYLYECSKIEGVQNPTKINCVYVCQKPALIDKCIEFKDIYERLLEYERQGEPIIQKYETLGPKMLSFISETVKNEIIKNNLKNKPDLSYSLFLRKHFPEVWDNISY